MPFRGYFWLFYRFLHALATKFEFDIEICAEPGRLKLFSTIKNIKIQCGIEGKLMKKKCKEDTVGMQ